MGDQDGLRKLTKRLAKSLEDSLRRLPDDFCVGFKYTRTGRNLTYPVILGELVQIVKREANVRHAASM